MDRNEYEYRRRRQAARWLPLLVIPLLLFLGLGGYQLVKNASNQPSAKKVSNAQTQEVSNGSRASNPNPQVGIGGAPNTTASPTPSQIPSPTKTTVTATVSPRPTATSATSTQPQAGVGGSGVVPNGAPKTGRGL